MNQKIISGMRSEDVEVIKWDDGACSNSIIWLVSGLFWLMEQSLNNAYLMQEEVFSKKLTFSSLFISLLVNTASVSILFERSSYFEEN